jgi:hypothetical protein
MEEIDHSLKPVIIRITDLNRQFTSEEITFPIWQRNENWPLKYKQDLILSILNKRMIPMLFFGEIEDKTYILDGGHRTRAINSFINNEFYIEKYINGIIVKIYYDKVDSNTLSEEEKIYFNNYPLPLYKYDNISENESRDIFNDLQHFRSMTKAEICNSYASHLIDYIRELRNYKIDNKTIYEILEQNNNSFINPKCHNYLLILIQLFSFFDGDSSIKSLTDCTGSTLVNYVKRFKQDDLTETYKLDFENTLQIYFKYIKYLPKNKFKTTTLYSIYHYIVWTDISDYTVFFNNLHEKLLNDLDEYDNLKKNIESLRKRGKEPEADLLREPLNNFNGMIIKWFDSTVMRGNTYNNGRKIRYSIFKNMFDYEEKRIEHIDDVTEDMEQVNNV